MFSLKQLDQVSACDTPFEFEVEDEEAKKTGIFLSVIGGLSRIITDFQEARLQESRVQEALAKKADPRDKKIHVRPVSEDMDFATKFIAIRVVGWRGIEEPFSPEAAIQLCEQNAYGIREQILLHSEKMGNFPLHGRKSSSSTPASSPG